MAVTIFTRTKRAAPPPMPRGDLLLEAPPDIPPPSTGGGIGTILRMLPMAAGAGAMALMMASGMMGGSGGRGVLGGVMGAMYGVSMLGMMMSQTGRGNDEQARQLDANRRDYFRYLGQMRRKVRLAADAQRRSFLWRHPSPEMLWTIAGQRRMWERRPDSDDFGSVRVSVGPQQFAQRIQPPESRPVEDLEPLTTGAVRRFIRTHKIISGAPVAINLRSYRHVRLIGEPDRQRRLAYAMVSQLATWHAPSELRIMVCVSAENQDKWDWVKWLPHVQHPTHTDGIGSTRMFATTVMELAEVSDGASDAENHPAHIVLVTDGVDGVKAESYVPPGTSTSTIEVTNLMERPRRIDLGVAVLNIDEDELVLHRRDPKTGQLVETNIGTPDGIPMVYGEMLARQLSPFRMPILADGADDEEEGPVAVFEPPKDYPAMLGVGDPLTLDVREAWKPRPRSMRLRIPFGTGDDGHPVELDIKESALGGMGPHGLCIGATGSGKSEFLRTLVLGLAMTHSSEQLNFVLVDFKGGATFLGLDSLPHVSATITNLEGELLLVDRMQDAIAGEMERRMEVLRASGNFKNREDYEEAREQGADLPPMPSLFLVVDEFSELLTARPDFIELFLQIGRIGRSVAVHLLLASQRLEEGKLRGLDTYLSYRIALRTFSAAESRTVIGVPDAYELPSPPGNGYLKFDTVSMVRFKAAYVSGSWEGSSQPTTNDTGRVGTTLTDTLGQAEWVPPVLEFVPSRVDSTEPPKSDEDQYQPPPDNSADIDEVEDEPVEEEEDEPDTLLSISVNKLRGHGWPAHQVWLPPLEEPPSMDMLFRDGLHPVEGRGLTTVDKRFHGTLHAPVALVDRPRQQRRDPMWMDLSGSEGNLAIVGGPQSGKSMAVRSTIAGLALTHTPDEVGFYGLDFGGGALMSMRELAHVGSVCGRLDVDRIRRTVAEMTSLMQAREVAFSEMGVDGIATYRRGRRDGTIEPDRFPADVFLVVDGWLTLRQEFEEQEQPIATIAARGLGFGLHVITTANKWSELRTNIRDMLQSRVELKLGDPFESEVNRKMQAVVPKGKPGRGISADSLHMLVALPRIDGSESVDDIADGQNHLVGAINSNWTGRKAADVRMLPDNLPFAALPRIEYDGHNRTIPIGIDEAELAPVWFDLAAEPLLAIFGAPECGKSSLLRVILNGITTRYTPQEAKIAILDYRHSLLGVVEGDHLLRYAGSSAAGNSLITDIAAAIKPRLPGPEVTQQQLRDKSWWKGPHVFVVVNDYELASTNMNHAMNPLADYVSLASDVGLHIIIARGMGGAGRAVFSDVIVSRMKDAQAPGLIMSGSRDEGALFGDVKPSSQPVGRGVWVTRAGKGLIQTAYQQGTE